MRSDPTTCIRVCLRLTVVTAVLLWGALSIRADSILLKGGERLIGKVQNETDDKVVFESQTLGLIEVARTNIERVERAAPPPPPETAAEGKAVPAPPAPDSIVPAAPPAVQVPGAESIVPAAPPEAPAVAAAPITPAGPVEPAVKPLDPAVVAQTATPTPVSPPVTDPVPPAPEVVPVFYPWSGLKTESDTFDWIQLKSGEWLKGQIKSLQNETLEFDSEEMDAHEFKWEDILIVRSPRLNSMGFEKAGLAEGSVLITGDQVQVISKSGTKTFPRSDLLAITPTGERERNKWSGKLSLGFNVRTGNTEEVIYNAHGTFERRTPTTRLSFDYLGNFSKINGATNANNQRITTQFDYFLSRKLYVRVPDVEYFSDPLQNINHRITLGASVGYDLFRTRRVEWDVSAGPAYQLNEFSSVEPGQSPTQESVTVVVSTHLDVQITKKIDWIFDYRAQLSKKESGGTTHHANSTIEFEIHKRLKLDLSLIWDRVTSPVSESGGSTPTPDDFQLVTSLGIDF